MNIAEYLYRTAALTPSREALFWGETCVADYGAFLERAGQVAAWLLAQGSGKGAPVAIFMKNLPDYLIVQYGIWMAGAVAVPINAKLHGREAAWIIDNAEAAIVFCDTGLAQSLLDAGTDARLMDVQSDAYEVVRSTAPLAQPVTCANDDLAWLFYTSGTTGRPKGVMITHRMLRSMALCYFVDADQVMPEDAALYAAPLSHGAGIYNIMHVMVGARHICPLSGGFDEAEIFELAAHFGRVHRPSEIGQLELALQTHEEVLELDVAVDHVLAVTIFQGARELIDVLGRALLVERACRPVLCWIDHLEKLALRGELQDQVDLFLGVEVPVEAQDVRVAQVGHDLHLAAQLMLEIGVSELLYVEPL